MSEVLSKTDLGTPQGSAESYQMIEMLTSDVIFDQEVQRLGQSIQDNPDLQRLHELTIQKIDALNNESEARRQGDRQVMDERTNITDGLIAEIESMPRELQVEYAKISEQIWWLTTRNTRLVGGDSIEAATIMELIKTAPKIQSESQLEPPFKHYAGNTEEAWSHVPRQAVEQYLDGRIFTDATPTTSGKGRIQILTKPGEALEVPLDLFIEAAGFDSWHGREGAGSHKDVLGQYAGEYDRKIHSSDLIKHYASLPSELPSISEVIVYVQPDGTMFANNGGGDSHRLAAAILRGQESVKADTITVIPVDTNFLTPNDLESRDGEL